MKRTHTSIAATLSAFTVLLASIALRAQVDTGTVSGTITDPSGAVIPGAPVTLKSEETGLTRSTRTGRDGTYTFTPVGVDTYTVAAERPGFKEESRLHVRVDVQAHVVVNFTLSPGAVTQRVVVTAPTSLLQTQTSSIGQVIGAREINDLPLNGRIYVFLAQLSAGVTVAQQDNLPNAGTPGMAEAGAFSANGANEYQNNFMLDGIDNNNTEPDNSSGWGYSVRPPIDGLAEFKVQTTDFSAEFGRAGGAVVNAVTKSGTDQFHGDAWEFVRNNAFDAADFFVNAASSPIGEYRQNQFGGTFGGPLKIPGIWRGQRRSFFFVDYEGLRIREGFPQLTTVPTSVERASGFTDFSDIITGLTGTTPADDLGRTFPLGAIFDPATTRSVAAGQVDPVTGLVATSSGYVRDPFPGNVIPSNRIDPNAVRLLNLYPLPTSPGLFNNFFTDTSESDDSNQVDTREDFNLSSRNQMFFRGNWYNSEQIVPPPFPGVAQGGGVATGDYLLTSDSLALGDTQTVSPTVVNESRLAFIRQTFNEDNVGGGNTVGIPQQYGIAGIPYFPGNGGLPLLTIGGLNPLGPQGFIPIFKDSNVWDAKDDFTKIQGVHTLKAGVDYMFNFIPYQVPPNSRGTFDFDGIYTSIPGANVGDAGIAQFLVKPIPATVPNGINNVGGADAVTASSKTTGTFIRNYIGAYGQDDWRATKKLTLNLGLRYDYFSPYKNRYDAESNFIPGAGAALLHPFTEPTIAPAFLQILSEDGIAFTPSTNVFGITPLDDFAPRFGFAYQLTQKLVIRGAYGKFFGGFMNNGGVAFTGAFNYPYLYRESYVAPDPAHPITPNNSIGLLENGLSNVALSPTGATISEPTLVGVQYRPPTMYTQGANFTLQYQLTPNQSFQIAYVGTFPRHEELFPYANLPSVIAPPTLPITQFIPYPDVSPGTTYTTYNGSGFYNSLQTNFERRFSGGLYLLGNFTWSACRTDGIDVDNNNANIYGYRAPDVPGFGIVHDYEYCDIDVRKIVHVSGGYELPFGAGHRFMSGAGRWTNTLVGGWRTNFILTLQDGQPFSIPCTISTAVGLGCLALLVPGQNPIGGLHNVNQWMNPAAFTNPPVATSTSQTNFAVLGGAPTQVAGPGFHRLDFSLFKEFQTSERTHLEFRAEFFNITNTPNFSIPVPGTSAEDFQSPAFGQITYTRDSPNDPREIQFALKFYW